MPIIMAALAVLVLLLIVLLVVRGFSQRVRGRKGQRIGITEYHEVDKSRRLVLIHRDEVEHLLLIGGPQDLVVESGIHISPVGAAAPEPMPAPIPLRPSPRPSVFAARRPNLRPVDPPLTTPRPFDPDDQA
jgi:hypothetical protein